MPRINYEMDEDTAMGREIQANLGVPFILKFTGTEANPDFEIIPLPNVDTRDVVGYEAEGNLLVPLMKGTPTPRRDGTYNYASDNLGALGISFSRIASRVRTRVVSAARRLATVVRHPVRTIRHPLQTFLPGRYPGVASVPLTNTVQDFQMRGQAPSGMTADRIGGQGVLRTSGGNIVDPNLLTIENLQAARDLFQSGSQAQGTYDGLLNAGDVTSAVDMASAVDPTYFRGAISAPSDISKYILPAALIGGALFLAKKRGMI